MADRAKLKPTKLAIPTPNKITPQVLSLLRAAIGVGHRTVQRLPKPIVISKDDQPKKKNKLHHKATRRTQANVARRRRIAKRGRR